MKLLATSTIRVYQKLIRPILDSLLLSVFGFTYKCKFDESCSQYTLRQIRERGTIPGSILGCKRIIRCWGFA